MRAPVMEFTSSLTSLCICLLFFTVSCKVYKRCELARELVDVHEIPQAQVATWVCIAYRESSFNTSAINYGSGDHGLFQISQRWWCSPPGEGFACAVSCAALEDDDIEDDVICARRIFRAHQRISGDGFSAWTVYPYFCKDKEKVKKYIEGCFRNQYKNNTQDNEKVVINHMRIRPDTTTETTALISSFDSTKSADRTIPTKGKTSTERTFTPSIIGYGERKIDTQVKVLSESPVVAYRYVSSGTSRSISIVPPTFKPSEKLIATTSKTEYEKQTSPFREYSHKTQDFNIKIINTERSEKQYVIGKKDYFILLTPNGFTLTKTDI